MHRGDILDILDEEAEVEHAKFQDGLEDNERRLAWKGTGFVPMGDLLGSSDVEDDENPAQVSRGKARVRCLGRNLWTPRSMRMTGSTRRSRQTTRVPRATSRGTHPGFPGQGG